MMRDASWYYVGELHRSWDKAMKAQEEVFGKKSESTKVCAFWADLFYLPRAAVPFFAKLSPYFADVHHEAAIPTVLSLLETAGGIPMRRPPLDCNGGCCIQGVSEKDLDDDPPTCAHKINFAQAEIRSAWEHVMELEYGDQDHK
eukprot:TRINITY_DN37119_c0_g1_i1.p2 TRINITY_DN37119_c0_g1~~TRINITY_DN37119_c0_g1_i1.p2  ORF type:complete len:144 (-),score=23.78 TRINITY_DN37119_c0_g1_i1:130-561(-)